MSNPPSAPTIEQARRMATKEAAPEEYFTKAIGYALLAIHDQLVSEDAYTEHTPIDFPPVRAT